MEKDPSIKIKDFNQGCWPQIMPPSAKPDQAQPEALRFSQLKKKHFSGFSPLVLTIERPLQIYQEAQDSPKGGFQNLEFNFFAYLFLLSHRFCPGRSMLEKKTRNFPKGRKLAKLKKWHNFFLRAVQFQGCVPGLCALKKNAGLPYPVKKVCSFFYKCPFEHCTVFSNYLLDVQRIGKMGTSFFTPLWQIECTSLVIATLKENDNFLYPQKKVYVAFETCRSSTKLATSLRGAKKLWNDVPAHTCIHPFR